MPLTRTESLVLDHWDEGKGARQIAQETGVPFDRVQQIVGTYHCRNETGLHRAEMAQGCERLREAVLAHVRPRAFTGKSAIWNTRTLADVAAQQGAVA